jgi:hypothetical protein
MDTGAAFSVYPHSLTSPPRGSALAGAAGQPIQGGALNRGLFFADPPPSPLGAVSGKISEIR